MQTPPPLPERELRYAAAPIEVRMPAPDEGGDEAQPSTPKPATVRGYAALFSTRSADLGGFIERIDPHAFDHCDMADLLALFNHDESTPLARTGAGLELGVDERGLWYEFPLLDTTVSRDLRTLFAAGVITQSSFAFTVSEDEGSQTWEESRDEAGNAVQKRTIRKIAKLYDVSPVTRPAYADTSVALRALHAARAKAPPAPEAPPAPPLAPPLTAAQRARLRLQTK